MTSKRSAYPERCPDRTYMEQIEDRKNRFVWSEKHLYRPHKHYSYDPCSWGRELEESSKRENGKLSVVERLEQLRERALERATNVQLLENEENTRKIQGCKKEEERSRYELPELEKEELYCAQNSGAKIHNKELEQCEEEQSENNQESEMPYYFYDEIDNNNLCSEAKVEMSTNSVATDGKECCGEEQGGKQSLQELIDDVQRLHDLLTAPRHSNKPILHLQEKYEYEIKSVLVKLYNRFINARVNVNITFNALIIVAYHLLRNIDYVIIATLQQPQSMQQHHEEQLRDHIDNSNNKSLETSRSLAEVHAQIRAVYEQQIIFTIDKDKSSSLLTPSSESFTSAEMCIELLYILNHPLLMPNETCITISDEHSTKMSTLMQTTKEILHTTFVLLNKRISEGEDDDVADVAKMNNEYDINSNMSNVLDSEHLETLLKCCVDYYQKSIVTALHKGQSARFNIDKAINVPLLRFVLQRSLNNLVKLCTMTIHHDTITDNTNHNSNNWRLSSTENDITNEESTNCVIANNNETNNMQQTLRRRLLRRIYRHPLLQEEHQKHLHTISCEDTLSLRGPKAIPLDPPTHPRGLVISAMACNEMSQMTNAVNYYLTLTTLQSPYVVSTHAQENNANISSNITSTREWIANERVIHKLLKIMSYCPNYDLNVSACVRLATLLFQMKVVELWREELWRTVNGNLAKMTCSSFDNLSAATIQDALSTNDAANMILRLILLLSRLEFNCNALHTHANYFTQGQENNNSVNSSNSSDINNNECDWVIHLDGNKLLAVLLIHLCNFHVTPISHQRQHRKIKNEPEHKDTKHPSHFNIDKAEGKEKIIAMLESEWFRLRGHALRKIMEQITVNDLLSAEMFFKKMESNRSNASTITTNDNNSNECSKEGNEIHTLCWEACLAFGSFKGLVPLHLWRSACLERLRGELDASICNKTKCSASAAEALLVLRSRYATHPHASKRVPVDDESVKHIAACVSVLLEQRVSVHDLWTSWEYWDVMSILSSLSHEESVNDVSVLLAEVREFLIAKHEDAKKVITFNN